MKLLVKYLIKEIERYKNINLILSGGDSPIKYYKSLADNLKKFKIINFLILDERVVSHKSNYSNYLNIYNAFKKNKNLKQKINPLIKKNLNSKYLNKAISLFKKYRTISILGLGEDGHFASIFYNSKQFGQQIDVSNKPKYFITEKLGQPKVQRITMSLSMILFSKKILLIINTKTKQKLLTQVLYKKKDYKKYPIYYLFKYAKNKILIYYKDRFFKLKKNKLTMYSY